MPARSAPPADLLPLPDLLPLSDGFAPALPGTLGTDPPGALRPSSPPPGDSAPEARDTPGTPSARHRPAGPAGTTGPTHGPPFTRAHTAPHDSGRDGQGAQRDERDGTPAPSAGPAPHAPPGGPPDGVLGGGRSTADQGTQRHGDPGAVPALRRPAPGLVPGATVRADASGTRDRCRDVPVPPA